jgi:hypothetical protein
VIVFNDVNVKKSGTYKIIYKNIHSNEEVEKTIYVIERDQKTFFSEELIYQEETIDDTYEIGDVFNYLDNPKYYGGQVFYIDGNQRLANIIQDEFIRQLSSPLKVRNMDDNIYMYKKLDIPGVLIECGFMSNVKERNMLVTSKYQIKIVKCIIDGLINYY